MPTNRYNVPNPDCDTDPVYQLEIDTDEIKVYVGDTYLLVAEIIETPDGSLSVTVFGSQSNVKCLTDPAGDLFYDVY
jgi:hypothetical protein